MSLSGSDPEHPLRSFEDVIETIGQPFNIDNSTLSLPSSPFPSATIKITS